MTSCVGSNHAEGWQPYILHHSPKPLLVGFKIGYNIITIHKYKL